jgi:hypothetical protein
MAEDGIVESSKATVLKRTPVDFDIGNDAGDDLGTQVSRIKGIKRSQYVEKDGTVIHEYDDELDFQELTPLKGSATEKVIKQKKAADRKSALAAFVDWGQSLVNRVSERISKAEEDDARRSYESKVVKLGDDPNTLTDAEYETYLLQRERDQKLATYTQKRDREGNR